MIWPEPAPIRLVSVQSHERYPYQRLLTVREIRDVIWELESRLVFQAR